MGTVPIYLKIPLSALRVRMNMTQEEAAKNLGITRETLRKWERDPSKIPFGYMEKIADIYYIPFDYIFFGTNIAFSEKVKKSYEVKS